MAKNTIRLTSAEISGLWTSYMNNTMAWCLTVYFLHHVKDKEIKAILQKSLKTTTLRIEKITEIFSSENIPIPDGFTDKDVNLHAPPLFYDPYALNFVYITGRMDLIFYSFAIGNIARLDIINFFTEAIQDATNLYKEATTLLLSKGLYNRAPSIPYPTTVKYIQKPSYINGLIHTFRPLNVNELTEIFFNIERNYFSVLLCIGLIQVVEDKEIKNYLKKGKKISEKQINFFQDLLKQEGFFGIVSNNIEVTEAKISPFSDKLIMNLFNSLNSMDITLIGHALSTSLRTDLSLEYSKLIVEILAYAEDGFNLLVERQWLEEPPSAPNRKELEK
ncbi:DUF3231 family protein [Heyndrickxia sp. NPDC080065]|uniref:DUF3231 family protein n=1 Tax=Heyndrickxia sp. NPDC080065 TaxID=3390568 RepID=UPI003D04F2EC